MVAKWERETQLQSFSELMDFLRQVFENLAHQDDESLQTRLVSSADKLMLRYSAHSIFKLEKTAQQDFFRNFLARHLCEDQKRTCGELDRLFQTRDVPPPTRNQVFRLLDAHHKAISKGLAGVDQSNFVMELLDPPKPLVNFPAETEDPARRTSHAPSSESVTSPSQEPLVDTEEDYLLALSEFMSKVVPDDQNRRRSEG